MKKDFSNESKQKILNLVAGVEKENFSHITDWIGDQYDTYQAWIGKLGIHNYINQLEVYQRKVIAKNNTSRSSINRVFSKAVFEDWQYKLKLSEVKSSLKKWDNYIVQMERIVNPNYANFEAEYITETLTGLIKNWKTKYAEMIDVLETMVNTVSLGTELADSDVGGMVADIGSLFIDIAKAGDADANVTMLQKMKTISSVFSGGLKIISGGLKLADLKDDANDISVISSIIGIYSELTKIPERSVAEQFKESSKLASKAGSLSKKVFFYTEAGKFVEDKISNLKDIGTIEAKGEIKSEKQGIKNNVSAIVAGASMVTYSIGDIMERSEDGTYDIKDYGNTLLNTGISGMSSLVSSITYGTVNIDVDRSSQVFGEAITQTQDFINNTGAPTPVKVALAIPGTVIAAAIGTVGTFIDFGMQIGENIKSIF